MSATTRSPLALWAPRPRVDVTDVLTLFAFLLLGIPSQLIVSALGGAGTPAQLLGLGALVWWLTERVRQPHDFLPRSQPVRKWMLVFMAALLASYVVASTRPISDDELRSSQMGLLSAASWFGILVLTSDGVRNRERLETFLRRLAWFAGLVALLAIVQFFTHQAWVDRIQIPGLTANHAIHDITVRGGLQRPAGTAIHPIEFGMVMTICLPFALHLALFGKVGHRFMRSVPVLAIAIVIPISISRSTLVCAALVLIVLLPTWPKVWRRLTYFFLVILGAVMYLLVPGLLGTVTGLFTGIADDSSALSRTDSYDLAFQFVANSPWFGRGFLTFLPSYRILDNQYLGLLIDTGIIGLGSMLALIITALVVCNRARKRSVTSAERHLSQAVLASVASGGVAIALFDAFSFPMAAAGLFLVLGCAGALHRISVTEHGAAAPRTGPAPGDASARQGAAQHLEVHQQ